MPWLHPHKVSSHFVSHRPCSFLIPCLDLSRAHRRARRRAWRARRRDCQDQKSTKQVRNSCQRLRFRLHGAGKGHGASQTARRGSRSLPQAPGAKKGAVPDQKNIKRCKKRVGNQRNELKLCMRAATDVLDPLGCLRPPLGPKGAPLGPWALRSSHFPGVGCRCDFSWLCGS